MLGHKQAPSYPCRHAEMIRVLTAGYDLLKCPPILSGNAGKHLSVWFRLRTDFNIQQYLFASSSSISFLSSFSLAITYINSKATFRFNSSRSLKNCMAPRYRECCAQSFEARLQCFRSCCISRPPLLAWLLPSEKATSNLNRKRTHLLRNRSGLNTL